MPDGLHPQIWHPSGVLCVFFIMFSGGVGRLRALNHRLNSGKPPACSCCYRPHLHPLAPGMARSGLRRRAISVLVRFLDPMPGMQNYSLPAPPAIHASRLGEMPAWRVALAAAALAALALIAYLIVTPKVSP